ncbi:hypothetical protein [Paenibacillus sp. D9]|uniref:hypothetical protein n=1 Tax=Paenibacillus sp. D9 TaxID=665792 RepID=UPI0012EE8926|nr:hypothetical protein [Paenibacillus sp. D9]
MANVQFNAKFEKITLASKNKVVLELPEGMNFAKIAEIASFRGHDMIVQFGNPQVEMLFDRGPGGALVAKIDGSGVVESAEREEGEDPGMELDFGSDELETGGDQPNEEAGEPESQEESGDPSGEGEEGPEPDVSKGELEEFILEVKPSFQDIPFDFPGILSRKRDSGESWVEIAKELNTSSSKLQVSFTAYKKRVKRMIHEQRDDNGAA